MSEVIVITSGKGGVGKTTTTANVGAALALQGKSVVLVDADIGLRNLDIVLGLENRIVYNIIDVIEERCRLHQALIKDKRFNGLYLLPAAQTSDKDAITPDQMLDICNDLKQSFDYVILDCPAGIEQGFRNAVIGANRALVVTTPEMSAVRDADRIIGMLGARGITQIDLIVNRIRPHMVRKGEMISVEDVLDVLAIDLIGVIPDDERVVCTTNRGEPVVTAEKSLSGRAYINISKRVIGEKVEFLDLCAPRTFKERIRNAFTFTRKEVI